MYAFATSACSAFDGEDRRAILRPGIRALPIELGRIVDHREENLQQPSVADLARVVGNLHRFRVPGSCRCSPLRSPPSSCRRPHSRRSALVTPLTC